MDTIELIARAQQGDNNARNRVITENIGLIWSIVRRFLGRGYEADDLFQIGCIGLMKAIDKFIFTYDVKFSTYAVPMITGEIKRFLRDDGMIKVSRSLKENANRIRHARESLEAQSGKEPTLRELAEILQLTEEEIVMALDSGAEVESLNQTIYQTDGNAIYLCDRIADQEDAHAKLVNHLALEHLLREMQETERELIRLRYFEEKTQAEVGNSLGISQVQVSRMEKRILAELRKRLTG